MVKEFLDFYGLGYADGFFQPAASCGVDFFFSPREELEKQLGISEENGETNILINIIHVKIKSVPLFERALFFGLCNGR